jgi:RNA-directed DNA polymerase
MGVPQGGPISPTILNLTLNGVDEIILAQKGTFLVRFADDILVLSDTAKKLEKVKEDLIEFLKPRGLELNEGKTKACTIEEGINFLGYNIKEYPNSTKMGLKRMPTKKGILLMKPAKKSVENFKRMIREVFKGNSKCSAEKLILNLNPKIRG